MTTERIRFRRDTAAALATANPVLFSGEPSFELDTGVVKVGDGVTAYNSLQPAQSGVYVAQTRKVNGQALTGDVTLRATDVAAAPSGITSAVLMLAQGDSTVQGFGRSPDGTQLGKGNSPTIQPDHIGFYQSGIQSLVTWACLYSGGRMLESFNGSYGGDQTTDMLTRLPNTLSKLGSIVLLGTFRNDPVVGGLPFQTSFNNIVTMVNQAIAAGKRPVLMSMFPDTSTASLGTVTGTAGQNTLVLTGPFAPGYGAGTMLLIDTSTNQEIVTVQSCSGAGPYTLVLTGNLAHTHTNAVVAITPTIRKGNAALERYATQNGIVYIDTYSAVVDPASTTGAWLSGYSSDGTHPTVVAAQAAGAKALADLVAAGIVGAASASKAARFLPKSRATFPNLLLNPLFQDDVNSDGIADSWTASVTAYNSTGPAGTALLIADGTTGSKKVTASGTAAASTITCNAPWPVGSNLTLNDGGSTETVTVKSVNATPTSAATEPWTITLTAPLAATHASCGVLDNDVTGAVQVCVIYTGTCTYQQSVNVDSVNVSSGDRIGWSGMVKTYGALAASGNYQAKLTYVFGATNPTVLPFGIIGGLAGAGSADLNPWLPFYREGVVPAAAGGTAQIRLQYVQSLGTPMALFIAQNRLVNQTAIAASWVAPPGNLPNRMAAPTFGTVGDTSIVVNWAAPAVDSSHDAATLYLLEKSPHNANTWTPVGTYSAGTLTGTATGLAASTNYDFRVTAFSSVGAALASPTAAATTAVLATIDADAGVTPSAFWGLRKGITGAVKAIQVRRSSDNTTQDIGFDGSGNLDTASMLTFCGAGSGFVAKWYDQTPNGHDLTQAGTGNQPTIVSAGVITYRNGKPVITIASSPVWLQVAPFIYAAGASTVCAVFDTTSSATQGLMGEGGAAASNNLVSPLFFSGTSGASGASYTDDANAVFASQTAGSYFTNGGNLGQASAVDTGSSYTGYQNGAANTTALTYTRAAHTVTLTELAVGSFWKNGASVTNFIGHLAEMSVWTSALTTGQRQAAEANQKAYYGTP